MKGNTEIVIPMAAPTAPTAHTHVGTSSNVSSVDHAASGTESAESMMRDW